MKLAVSLVLATGIISVAWGSAISTLETMVRVSVYILQHNVNCCVIYRGMSKTTINHQKILSTTIKPLLLTRTLNLRSLHSQSVRQVIWIWSAGSMLFNANVKEVQRPVKIYAPVPTYEYKILRQPTVTGQHWLLCSCTRTVHHPLPAPLKLLSLGSKSSTMPVFKLLAVVPTSAAVTPSEPIVFKFKLWKTVVVCNLEKA